jgi:hypothetical protein
MGLGWYPDHRLVWAFHCQAVSEQRSLFLPYRGTGLVDLLDMAVLSLTLASPQQRWRVGGPPRDHSISASRAGHLRIAVRRGGRGPTVRADPPMALGTGGRHGRL